MNWRDEQLMLVRNVRERRARNISNEFLANPAVKRALREKEAAERRLQDQHYDVFEQIILTNSSDPKTAELIRRFCEETK